MATENSSTQQEQTPGTPQAGTQPTPQSEAQAQGQARGEENFDGLADKKPEELTPEELRLMADTMPGEGPGD